MRKKQFEKDFEFVLSKNQKNYLINKSNNLYISGAEYMRLLIEQDMLLDELSNLKANNDKITERLTMVKYKLNNYRNKSNG